MNGMLFFPGGAIYGGSRKTSAVSIAGEVIVANEGSPIVQTANPPTTPWNSGSIDVGMLLRLKTGLGDHRYYAVKSIDNDHQVTLASPYLGPSFVDFIDFEFVPVGSLSQVATIYFVAGNRLIACDGDRAYESNIGDPNTFTADEYQRVPAGAQILGGEGIRDTGLLFTTAGVWAIGNLAFRLTDANGSMQQRFEQVSRDLIVWSWPGITQWGTRLIVPAVDGVWLVDSISAPERITTGLDELYRSYVDAGHHTGIAAVFNNHYFLPILDSSNALIDLLVCRLAPTRRGHAFGWTRFSGDGATVSALAVRAATTTARQPALLGAHRTNGRVLRLPYHIPSATDADASAFQMELVSRQWFSGNLVKNFVAKIRARIASTGTTAAAWQEEDGGWTSLSPDAAAATLTGEPAKWNVGKLRRAIRFRLRSSGPFVLHSLEVFIRQSGRQ